MFGRVGVDRPQDSNSKRKIREAPVFFLDSEKKEGSRFLKNPYNLKGMRNKYC